MGRLIGFVLMILAIWTGIEIYNYGLADAFGGVLGSAFEAPANRKAVAMRSCRSVSNRAAFSRAAKRLF